MMEGAETNLFLANPALSHHKPCESILGACHCCWVAFIDVVKKSIRLTALGELKVLIVGKLQDTKAIFGRGYVLMLWYLTC